MLVLNGLINFTFKEPHPVKEAEADKDRDCVEIGLLSFRQEPRQILEITHHRRENHDQSGAYSHVVEHVVYHHGRSVNRCFRKFLKRHICMSCSPEPGFSSHIAIANVRFRHLAFLLLFVAPDGIADVELALEQNLIRFIDLNKLISGFGIAAAIRMVYFSQAAICRFYIGIIRTRCQAQLRVVLVEKMQSAQRCSLFICLALRLS